jgi:DNA-directed RNA polymerase subunit RPC12/RpoP
VTYRIKATAERVTIECLKCGSTSDKPKDVRLRRCPKCGFHSVFPPGMGGLLEAEDGSAVLLGLGVAPALQRREAVPPEDE